LNFFIKLFTNDNYSTANIINDIVLYLKQFITIVIVVIPEGLPLVISMSLAYSVSLMKKDGLLIKKLDCPETNAKINQIMVNKFFNSYF
jgi:Ca2+-transporting ATPase